MRALALISGGIDSPVAAHLMIKRGIDIVAIHFDNHPFTDKKTLEKAGLLVKRISRVNNKKIKLYVINHGKILSEIIKNTRPRFTCILCKRFMMRMAQSIAEKEKCDFLVTGESLGQVASQTLNNMTVISRAVNIDILRPLLCMDKNETIKIAKDIGTYEISIIQSAGCKAVPKHPATSAKLEIVLKEEEKININKLVEDTVKNAKCHTC